MHSNLSMSKVNLTLCTENHAMIKGVPKQPSLFLHIIEFFPLVNRSLYPITVLPTVPTNCTVPTPLQHSFHFHAILRSLPTTANYIY